MGVQTCYLASSPGARCTSGTKIALTYQNIKIMIAIENLPGSGNSMNNHQMDQQPNAQWQQVMNTSVVPYPMLQHTSG